MKATKVTLSGRAVFARLMSITQKEYFTAAQQGLKPAHMFRVRKWAYAGETRLTYDGTVYAIYRTYVTGSWIELYTTEKRGLNE